MMPDMLSAPESIATARHDPFAARDRAGAIALCAIGFLISAVCGLLHPGGILHFDDLTHYLYAKWAWTWPAYLVNDWGRPGFTALYFLPAAFGWEACRLLSAALTAGSAYLAWSISRQLGIRHAWAAIIFTFAQPVFFQLSQTTLTETALAFYLALSTHLAIRKHWTVSSIILSLAFVTRHEAIVFLPIWLAFALREKVPLRRLWPLLWAPVVVNAVAPLTGSTPAIAQFFNPSGTGQYGRGGWLTFFSRSMEAFGPGISVLAMIGLTRVQRAGGNIVTACIVIYFVAQTAVRALGLYDTGGYARFLVGISPLIAVAALAGWMRLYDSDPASRHWTLALAAGAMGLLWLSAERQLALFREGDAIAAEVPKLDTAVKAVRYAVMAVAGSALLGIVSERILGAKRLAQMVMPTVLVVMIVLAVYALCRPLRPPPEAAIIASARQQLTQKGYDDRPLVAASIWMTYVTNQRFPPWRPRLRQQLESAVDGTLFAWERQFAGSSDHNLPLAEFLERPEWRLVLETEPLPHQQDPYLYVFEKSAAPNRR